jgi:hypothetical protein
MRYERRLFFGEGAPFLFARIYIFQAAKTV